MTWQQRGAPDDWPTLFAARDAYLAGQLGLFDRKSACATRTTALSGCSCTAKAVEFDPAQQPVKMMAPHEHQPAPARRAGLRRREAQLATMIPHRCGTWCWCWIRPA